MRRYIKEIIGNPVTDAQGKEIPFSPIGGDCGVLEIDETKPENAARIAELDKLCGRFGIYSATEEQVALKKRQQVWRPLDNPSIIPRVLQTSQDQSQPRGSAAVGNHPPSAAQLAQAATERINDGQPKLVRASMPRETGFPNQQRPTGYQHPATSAPAAQPPPPPAGEPPKVLGQDFKPKVGSPKRGASKLPTDKPAETAATT